MKINYIEFFESEGTEWLNVVLAQMVRTGSY